jgi:hypothetical protein
MNNLEQILRECINDIKSKWDLPKSGFLSGGSIANLAWEKISGNKAIINDLDIYNFIQKVDDSAQSEIKQKQSYQKKDKIVFEDYSGINVTIRNSNFYLIEKVSNEGIFNLIDYKSNTDDPQIIIDSFDINCCQVGYDISTDKFYWTKEFEKFLKTGELRLVNLSSPAHSAIRLVKKEKDLNAKLPDLELDITAYATDCPSFLDTTKYRFKERYANMFRDNISRLDSRFDLIRDTELEESLEISLGVVDKLYKLKPKIKGLEIDDSQKIGIQLSTDFLFWVRNIFQNHDLETKWFNLHLIFDTKLDNYLDCNPTKDEIELLNRLVCNAPDCVRHLNGFPLSRQLYIVNTLFEKFKNDPIIAISILETYCIDYNINLESEIDLLLLELSVRKMILEDPKDKVRKILQKDPTPENTDIDFSKIHIN